MATMTIRNVPDHVREALRVEAAKSGRSMEEALRLLVIKAAAVNERTSRIDAAEILKRAAELASDPPIDSRYKHFTQKELSDAISGEFENL
ncbi:MAG: plasmid stabilization protein [Phyllobacteriaceae bacterium]|nr:plasmid stabilization protein [Phyllobacteriaceae bacterium]